MLPKPFNVDALVGMMEGLLSERQAPITTDTRAEDEDGGPQFTARGYTNAQIGEKLVLTMGSVANHVEPIRGKLDFANRA